jgi:hypothetical protein
MPMNDTHPKIEAMRIEGLRRMGPIRRLQLADEWTHDILTLAWVSLQERHPEVSEEELRILWVEHLYGADLARRVKAYLEGRRS